MPASCMLQCQIILEVYLSLQDVAISYMLLHQIFLQVYLSLQDVAASYMLLYQILLHVDLSLQDVAISYVLLYQILLQVPAMILLPCFGSLCDTLGRKVLVLISTAGCAVSFFFCLVRVVSQEAPPGKSWIHPCFT